MDGPSHLFHGNLRVKGSIGEAASRRFGYQVTFGWALTHQQEVDTAVTFERNSASSKAAALGQFRAGPQSHDER